MHVMERNVDVFDHRRVAGGYERAYAKTAQFLDLGEEAALRIAASHVRSRPILDVGAGTGRLAPLLQLASDDYVAIDYAPSMVDAFRRCHPGVDVSVGDARDLSRFTDGSFGLVVFSNNGIDAVSHDDRIIVLREFARVVEPDGRIVFSSLNRNGVAYAETPFRYNRRIRPSSAKERVIAAARFVARLLSSPRSIANWRRARPLAEDHGTWALGPLAVHEFSLFVHFTTLADLRATVDAAGLQIECIYDERGSAIAAGDDDSAADCFTVVAHH